MRTLTLFNAYVAACRQSHEVCVHLAANASGMPTAELLMTINNGQRRERFVATLECAIRVRLTPPAPQHTSNGDYAGDLVNDSEAGRIDQSSLSAG